jgi:uncharacterized RDD family membrane protein YckC|eukprot:gene37549-46322_t
MDSTNPYQTPQTVFDGDDQGLKPGELQYAGFWRRFGAFWLDALCLAPLTAVVLYLSTTTRYFHALWLVPGLLFGLWFNAYLVKRYGGTPGKLMMKIRVAMVDGAAVTGQAAMLRYSVMFVLSAASSAALVMASLAMGDERYLSVGFMGMNTALVEQAPLWYPAVTTAMQIWIWGEFVTMLFNKRRRAVHDYMAGTVVVRKARV